MALKWDEMYETGIAEIDRQHQNLFEHINDLEKKIQAGDGQRRMAEMLQYLKMHTKAHFSYEEDCMEKYQCPAATKNYIAHQKFMKIFEELENRFQSDPGNIYIQKHVHSSIEIWVDQHLRDVDIHLRECVVHPE